MLLSKNTILSRCKLQRMIVPEPVKKVYRKMKDTLRAAFTRSNGGAKNDVAKTNDPFSEATPGHEDIPLTCMLKCSRCSCTLPVDPTASYPFDSERPLDSSASWTRPGACVHLRPLQELKRPTAFLPLPIPLPLPPLPSHIQTPCGPRRRTYRKIGQV